MIKIRLVVLAVALVKTYAVDAGQITGECETPSTVINDVRVFNGERLIDHATVVLGCGKIMRMVEAAGVLDLTEQVERIDWRGKTLMPGLIDSHTHNFRRETLVRALDFGVTTVIDTGSAASGFARAMKDERSSGTLVDRADMVSAALWITAPGSHGTQFGEVPTLERPEDAEQFVLDRIAEGAEIIKII